MKKDSHMDKASERAIRCMNGQKQLDYSEIAHFPLKKQDKRRCSGYISGPIYGQGSDRCPSQRIEGCGEMGPSM